MGLCMSEYLNVVWCFTKTLRHCFFLFNLSFICMWTHVALECNDFTLICDPFSVYFSAEHTIFSCFITWS